MRAGYWVMIVILSFVTAGNLRADTLSRTLAILHYAQGPVEGYSLVRVASGLRVERVVDGAVVVFRPLSAELSDRMKGVAHKLERVSAGGSFCDEWIEIQEEGRRSHSVCLASNRALERELSKLEFDLFVYLAEAQPAGDLHRR